MSRGPVSALAMIASAERLRAEASASERGAAVNIKKAAIEREFAARGITEQEVRG